MHDKVTQKDIERMEEEIRYRRLVVRKEALEDVKTARAFGDLSENYEYKAAKEFKNENEKRIRYLENMIRTAEIIPEDSAPDEVGMNNRVVLYFADSGTEETYTIVTTVRADSLKHYISPESPLGRAVVGHKAGDTVHVTVSDEVGYDVTIRSIENTGDDGSIELRKY